MPPKKKEAYKAKPSSKAEKNKPKGVESREEDKEGKHEDESGFRLRSCPS